MKKVLLLMVVPLLLGAACTKVDNSVNGNIAVVDNSVNGNIAVPVETNNLDCSITKLSDCPDKNKVIVGIFDKKNLRLIDVNWNNQNIGSVQLAYNENLTKTTYNHIPDGQKVAIQGKIKEDENGNYVMQGLFTDIYPDTLECDSTFACYVKGMKCEKAGFELLCIKNNCECKWNGGDTAW
ncbi:hypothetical protein C0580_02690 [Candidatus Parcubacteria bacterium]|nr:MAG: hypothetical protein C0580_02690 [Candidatus Parcubacteria bacterium]